MKRAPERTVQQRRTRRARGYFVVSLLTTFGVAAACSGVDDEHNPPLGSRVPNEPTGATPVPGEGTTPPSNGDPDGNGSTSGGTQGDAGLPQGDSGFVADTGVQPDGSGFGGNGNTSINPTGAGGTGG